MVLTGHGGWDMLEYREDVPDPVSGPGEVVVAVAACGVNNTDINTRTGWYAKSVSAGTGSAGVEGDEDGSWGGGLTFPRIQGADPVGRISDVGPGVDQDRIGQRVIVDPWIRGAALGEARYLGSEVDGGYAEFVKVPAENAIPIRAGLTDVELAGFACSYGTAEHMLHRAGVAPGQWLLVTGASGGVGGALVQLGRRRGARVAAITSLGKADQVRDLGAEVVIDRADPNLAAQVFDTTGGVDIIADVVGGRWFAPLLETLRRGGHYTTAGAIAGPVVDLDLRTLYLNDLTMHGATVVPPGVFRELVQAIERGEVRPVIAATFELPDLVAAQQAFMEKAHVGKIVVRVGEVGGGSPS